MKWAIDRILMRRSENHITIHLMSRAYDKVSASQLRSRIILSYTT